MGGLTTSGGIGAPSNLVIARYNLDGSLDTSFGTNGLAILDTAYDEQTSDLIIQADGKILASRRTLTTQSQSSPDSLLLRLLPNGTLDSSFGQGGLLATSTNDGLNMLHIALQPDGSAAPPRIIVGGSAPYSAPLNKDLVIARYLGNGTPDLTFGNNGAITTDFGGDDSLFGLALQADGEMVAGGNTYTNPFPHYVDLARYLPQ